MPSPAAEPRTHDYTSRCWGHDYAILQVRDGGQELSASGWGPALGPMLKAGDYLLLQGKQAGSSTRYQVAEVRYCSDPDDMWFATLKFAPRQAMVKEAAQ